MAGERAVGTGKTKPDMGKKSSGSQTNLLEHLPHPLRCPHRETVVFAVVGQSALAQRPKAAVSASIQGQGEVKARRPR
jgi:hypothetical protein